MNMRFFDWAFEILGYYPGKMLTEIYDDASNARDAISNSWEKTCAILKKERDDACEAAGKMRQETIAAEAIIKTVQSAARITQERLDDVSAKYNELVLDNEEIEKHLPEWACDLNADFKSAVIAVIKRLETTLEENALHEHVNKQQRMAIDLMNEQRQIDEASHETVAGLLEDAIQITDVTTGEFGEKKFAIFIELNGHGLIPIRSLADSKPNRNILGAEAKQLQQAIAEVIADSKKPEEPKLALVNGEIVASE